MYSKLAFSKKTDRSVALQGLEHRLARTMNTKVQFGILENMLGRSLLWRAATPQSMERIVFDADRDVPSWSWMAYMGAIDYEEVPFDDTEWHIENIRNPFGKERYARARDFSLDESDFAQQIFLDEPGAFNDQTYQCVVIGKQGTKRNAAEEDRLHYVMVIKASATRSGFHERAGIGRLWGRQISDVKGDWLRMN